MKIEQMLKAIKAKEELINTHENLLVKMNEDGKANISSRGSWSVEVDLYVAKTMVENQLDTLRYQLSILEEAKKAGEITMEGWLNKTKEEE